MEITPEDRNLLIRDKYAGNASLLTAQDLSRLAEGEPLAYVIGWVPFLGLTIGLGSKPLIPRPETEWWTELLIRRIGAAPATVLDVCAGSGAVGLAVLKHCPNAVVAFGELSPAHCIQIEENLERNGLDVARAIIQPGDLFKPFPGVKFQIVASNPPYIPEGRALDESVIRYEPPEALFAGEDGLSLIRRIAKNASHHLAEGGEVWLEADAENAADAAALFAESAARTDIRTDPYGRERLVLAYY